MIEYEDGSYKVQEFGSFNEVAEYIEKTPNLEKYGMAKEYLYRGFNGVSDIKECYDRLRYGDQKQTTSFIKELKDVDEYTDSNDGVFMDIEGFGYDMGAVVSGEPECCLNTGSPVPKKSMNIYIDIGYCGETSIDIINNRGYAIVKLLNSLLAKGIIVNLYVVHYITTHDDYKDYAQIIKIPTDFLTLATVGYSCTCDFFRAVTWLLTAIQKKKFSYNGGDGCSKPRCEILERYNKRGDLYIPSGYTDERLNSCNKTKAEQIIFDIYDKYVESRLDKCA